MIMPGGWHYLQRIESDVLPVEALNYDALLDAVKQFRLDNDIPVGNVKADVDAQICERFPHQCNMEGPGTVETKKPTVSPYQMFIDRISHWAVKVLNTPMKEYVLDDEAQRRAAICAQCPMNDDWKMGCPQCVTKASQVLTLIRAGRGNRVFKRTLKGCKAVKHDNETAVWLDRKHLSEHVGETPENCWLR